MRFNTIDMYRIWHVEIFLSWLEEFRVLKFSHILRNYDIIVTFLKVLKLHKCLYLTVPKRFKGENLIRYVSIRLKFLYSYKTHICILTIELLCHHDFTKFEFISFFSFTRHEVPS